MDIPDYQIANLIGAARFLLKMRLDWYESVDNNNPGTMPDYYIHYLRIKHSIKRIMKQRRQHRKNVAHIWDVYAQSVIKERNAKHAGDLCEGQSAEV